MMDLAVVLSCVLILRRIAAANVATTETHPQMNPSVANLHAILANMLVGLSDFDLIEVRAFHVQLPPKRDIGAVRAVR
jgi:hypothetical protein